MRSGRRRKLEERVGCSNTLTPNDAHLGDIAIRGVPCIQVKVMCRKHGSGTFLNVQETCFRYFCMCRKIFSKVTWVSSVYTLT